MGYDIAMVVGWLGGAAFGWLVCSARRDRIEDDEWWNATEDRRRERWPEARP